MPNIEQMRDLIARELNIADLPEVEQDNIISRVGELIVRAVSIAIFSRLPVSIKPEYDRLQAVGDDDGLKKLVADQIPDLDTVIDGAIKGTVGDYKKALTEVGV